MIETIKSRMAEAIPKIEAPKQVILIKFLTSLKPGRLTGKRQQNLTWVPCNLTPLRVNSPKYSRDAQQEWG
jgi:hypothetical protein